MIVLATRDDEARRRWRAALASGAIVREVDDRRALGRALAASPARVVLLDLALPGVGDVRAIASLARQHPTARLIALSPRPSEREGIGILRAGAHGYCARDVDTALLGKAVAVVQHGEVWASRALFARLVEELAAAARRRPPGEAARAARRLGALTRREYEIARGVGGGAANKEIAQRLGVTERTVKAHLTAIFRKLGVGDRLRLALLLNGLSAPPPG
jgi:DNA-binding NarL/FixJ family response regulator